MTLLATVEDCSRVADQVHWETMVVAVRPIETFPPDYVDCYDESLFSLKIIRYNEILQIKEDT